MLVFPSMGKSLVEWKATSSHSRDRVEVSTHANNLLTGPQIRSEGGFFLFNTCSARSTVRLSSGGSKEIYKANSVSGKGLSFGPYEAQIRRVVSPLSNARRLVTTLGYFSVGNRTIIHFQGTDCINSKSTAHKKPRHKSLERKKDEKTEYSKEVNSIGNTRHGQMCEESNQNRRITTKGRNIKNRTEEV